MDRREFLGGALAAAALPFGASAEETWAPLAAALPGRVAPPAPVSPADAPFLRNPFFRGDTPALTQNAGWLDAWQSTPSACVVAAQSAEDVAAAVRFAAARKLRLVVRGGGHSYLGTSCAPDSLMIWTRKLDRIDLHDAFTPQGAQGPGVPAISLGAGCVWLRANQAAQAAGRYVQGGGCTTVGVGGLLLGGGFGSFSKRYGLAAASLLEAEIVTADGALRVVNAAQDPDLFWALKGGGGGTFGVVTRFTLKTHPLPDRFGALNWTVKARSDDAFRKLIARFLAHYKQTLFNPHWGEQARVTSDNQLRLNLVFQGLGGDEAKAGFAPLTQFVADRPGDYETPRALEANAVWAGWFWSPWLFRTFARDAAQFDGRPGARWSDFWWTGDGRQAGAFWHAYQSLWLPAASLGEDALADALFEASRSWAVELHFNKGLAGAPDEALAAARDTAINPDALSAFALAIIAANAPNSPADASAADAARERAMKVNAAMVALRKAAPQAGSYLNECDYFQENWAHAQWGDNFARLADVKRRYDPDNLFCVHHGIGSPE